MEIENVDQLLDYVFTDEDISDAPSLKEYKKLTRIMQVMVRFYEKGEEAKRVQHEALLAEIEKITLVEKMIEEQMKVLLMFPAFHPKRTTYEATMIEEAAELKKQKARFQEQCDKYGQLYHWGQGIVSTMHWLDKNLKFYSNQELKTGFEGVDELKISSDDFKKYKRGLDEVTYNLQESQDFFDASLDGRLHKYHQIEKCMIEAQLEAIRKFPENNERRRHVELELEQDLQYVCDNMQENPKVRQHRERMQSMHKDFFAILKWHRRKIDQILADEPHLIIGDVEKLKEDLKTETPEDKAWHSKFGKNGEAENHTAAPVMSGGGCPVRHGTEDKKDQGFIHKLYEKDS